MPDGLAFTLYAPLAALGDLAVGERRGGFDRPARSAIFGLVAAALGLDRLDEGGHDALDRGYRMAQRIRLGGMLVTDYHTVQAPQAERKARWQTRREALDQPSHKLNTLLSTRDYRADLWVDIALIRHETTGPPPAAVAQALRRPAFTLFLGRKACPLGLPLAPVVVEKVEHVGALFDALDAAGNGRAGDLIAQLRRTYRALWRDADTAPLFADRDLTGDAARSVPDLLAPGYRPIRVERRRDRVASRRRRQFELRDEIVAEPVARSASEPSP